MNTSMTFGKAPLFVLITDNVSSPGHLVGEDTFLKLSANPRLNVCNFFYRVQFGILKGNIIFEAISGG